ncbi:MAG: hypothetical protein JKX98_08875 [Alcanivoracaceae bacterium]|nr:hypothetical protein [Flavobacteriales bacterium]MBL4773692.1 hypothetical protein [Alcanivoracaceae bacterium]
MKKIVASIFIITVLVSCSSSKNSTSATTKEKTDVPETPTPPKRVNNYPVK